MISRSLLGHLTFAHLKAEGVPVETPASPLVPTTFDQARELGELIARAHTALDRMTLTGGDDPSQWQLTMDMLTGGDCGWLDRGLHDAPHELVILKAWREEALASVASSSQSDSGLCHGEVYPAACRHLADGRLAISELDWVAGGAREYDLATFLWILTLHRRDESERLFAEFLEGYATRRTPHVTSGLRAWVAARHLWSMRLAIGFEGPPALARRADFARNWPLS